MAYTVAYQPSQEGFTSFFTFYPEMAAGVGNFMYTFRDGQIYKHNAGLSTTFYGSVFDSNLVMFFNDAPTELKLFKTVSIDGTYQDPSTLLTPNITGYAYSFMGDKEYTGSINLSIRKEGIDYSYIKTTGTPDGASAGVGMLLSQAANRFSVASSDDAHIPSIGIDYLAYVAPGSSVESYIGTISSYEKNGNVFTYRTSSSPGSIPNGSLIMVGKNTRMESYGLRGTHMALDLTIGLNTEIFSVSTEVLKSFP